MLQVGHVLSPFSQIRLLFWLNALLEGLGLRELCLNVKQQIHPLISTKD
jgi:hypothetical protein